MDPNNELNITDPTDWADTRLPIIQRLDNALRCQVCKEFLTAPLITECCHTFCSLCIRRCLTSDQKCPSCRAPEMESRLRKNNAVEEIVEAFVTARKAIMGVATEKRGAGPEERDDGKDTALGTAERGSSGGTPSRRSLRRSKSNVSYAEPTMDVDEGGHFVNGDEGQAPMGSVPAENVHAGYELDDGLVPCPVCNVRMKEDRVPFHIDKCLRDHEEGKKLSPHLIYIAGGTRSGPTHPTQPSSSPRRPRSTVPVTSNNPVPIFPSAARSIQPIPDRLPKLNYTLLTEKKLREKLVELGIPSNGPKYILQARHTEWVNLFNANRDSRSPKSKKELLNELAVWERTVLKGGQGGAGTGAGVQVKPTKMPGWSDEKWAKENKESFDELIKRARKKRKVGEGEENQGEERNGKGKGKEVQGQESGATSVGPADQQWELPPLAVPESEPTQFDRTPTPTISSTTFMNLPLLSGPSSSQVWPQLPPRPGSDNTNPSLDDTEPEAEPELPLPPSLPRFSTSTISLPIQTELDLLQSQVSAMPISSDPVSDPDAYTIPPSSQRNLHLHARPRRTTAAVRRSANTTPAQSQTTPAAAAPLTRAQSVSLSHQRLYTPISPPPLRGRGRPRGGGAGAGKRRREASDGVEEMIGMQVDQARSKESI
ncbi:hypothetical protein BDZ91DRAFT_731782 [Kalaharituber pfeilii]|nr:hypothetical protein BDZ91DRAFT_731782 [Kalaharituber pfeilii]